MIAVGTQAPDFEGPTADGGHLRLSELRGRPVVLYFFPKAGTFGCTRESLEFANRYSTLHHRGVHVVGVSVDDIREQREFALRCALPFPLVSDSKKEIARRFGVLGSFGYAKRVTFLIDADGRVVQVIDAMLPGSHASQAVARFAAGSGAAERPPPPSDAAGYSAPSRSK